MRRKILELGLWRSYILLVLVGILASNLLNAIFMRMITGDIALISILITTVVSGLVGASLGYFILYMLFELEKTRVLLRKLSITDELTQSSNRRYFIDCLRRQLALSLRTGSGFSVILFDLDNFKQVNDTYGHLAGDLVLQQLSQLCLQRSRASDVFARYGGEEFAFLLPGANREAALNFAERIRDDLEQVRVEFHGQEIAVTASFGVFSWCPPIRDLETVLVQVDGALYQAKLTRNSIVVA